MSDQENAKMQDRGSAPEDGAAFAARLAAMTPAEREVCFPNHSDGQVCR